MCSGYRELAHLSAGCARLEGKYQGITNSFAATCIAADRTTCMPYPRRQRSSWARIKLSKNVEVEINADKFAEQRWTSAL